MNGSTVLSGNIVDLQRFRDPTPAASGNFGTTAAGGGDLVGDARNEIMIGEFGNHNPAQNDEVISDVTSSTRSLGTRCRRSRIPISRR